MYKKLFTLLALAALASCQPRKYCLKDLIDTEAIDSVTIHNNSGDYQLSPTELRAFRGTLGKMRYLPEADLKMGTIGFSVYLDGRGYYAATRTHGQHIKIHRALVDDQHRFVFPVFSPIKSEELLFELDGAVNIDNFRKQP
ncbi:hypothetical protein GCM10011378_27180 [Hymenobacter glacieicola]|uniref:DUF4292 domain-containing protein n=1 Tax=Hymenobacter glacieicola TaxID=1562124 RepID=A0ABQ1X030_9BACT|nr:hypothetical protein GCM10011378_27180 [Hymenobacter glacieicola]